MQMKLVSSLLILSAMLAACGSTPRTPAGTTVIVPPSSGTTTVVVPQETGTVVVRLDPGCI
jgi:hypothetical protein